MKLRHVLFGLDKKYKKKPKYAEDESDLDDNAVAAHEEQSQGERDRKGGEEILQRRIESLKRDGEKAQPRVRA